MDFDPDPGRRDAERLAAARAVWEELAVKARLLHCPEHAVLPWRVVVIGDTRDALRLHIYGCCERLGQAVTEMVSRDPRVAGPG